MIAVTAPVTDPIDKAILKAKRVSDVAEPPVTARAAEGTSFYWDMRLCGYTHKEAVIKAAYMLGTKVEEMHPHELGD